jgi:hypothetical protein
MTGRVRTATRAATTFARGVVLWSIAAAAVLAGGAARAQPKRHSVAVLEHRSGAAALDGVATRLATEFGRLTGFSVSSPD